MKTIAAFDFDGTLTTEDAFGRFLPHRFGYFPTLFYFFSLIPCLMGFALGFVSRQRAKEAILTKFFRGTPSSRLEEWGQCFTDEVLPKLFNPEMLDKLAWHQARGHECVIVSATFPFILQPWAQKQAINHVICSEIALDQYGNVSGKLKGKNCWGPEKAKRLLDQFGSKDQFYLYAYGNSRGDHELLELADEPFLMVKSSLTRFSKKHT